MLVQFRARNLDVTDSLKEYTEKRLSKFDKLIGEAEATVTMRSIKDRQRIEVTIPYNGIIIRGEEEGYDMYACVDLVVDKLESQLHKYRTRLIKRGRGAKVEPVQPEIPWQEDDEPVRIKHFPTKPMSVEEAIMQMNLLGHNFFVFFNNDTNVVNVVYRRQDREYGLLTPEE